MEHNNQDNPRGHGPEHAHEEHHRAHHEPDSFWREWREEQRHRMHDLRSEQRHEMHGLREEFKHQVSQNPTPEEIGAWRDYFKRAMGHWPEEHWIFGGRRFSPWHQGVDHFNPFVANLLSKGGGLLPLYVLHLVSQKPRYGNEIMDILAEKTGGQWISNPGAIYPLLNQLEHEGFIQGEWEDPQKRTVRIYTLTATGQDELARLKDIMTPKIDETIKVLQVLMQDLGNDSESTTSPTAGEALQ